MHGENGILNITADKKVGAEGKKYDMFGKVNYLSSASKYKTK